jgi:hypothetical protein
MVTLPAETPLTTPVPAPAVATDVLLLVHVPPGVALLSVVVAPTQTVEEPGLMAGGAAITVTGFVTKHPATVYVMLAVPVPVPVTIPVLPTVATEVLLLAQVPPGVALDNESVVPMQINAPPEGLIAAGLPLTDTVDVTKQVALAYVIIAVPTVTPVTIPVDEPMVATDVLLLLHVPPPVALDNVVVAPTQTDNVPVIAAGNEFTVTTLVAAHPVTGSVYDIVDVPAVIPETTPVPEPTVATVIVVLLHVPPLVALLNDVVDPAHTDAVPVTGAGNGLTVTVVKPGAEEGQPLKYAVTE